MQTLLLRAVACYIIHKLGGIGRQNSKKLTLRSLKRGSFKIFRYSLFNICFSRSVFCLLSRSCCCYLSFDMLRVAPFFLTWPLPWCVGSPLNIVPQVMNSPMPMFLFMLPPSEMFLSSPRLFDRRLCELAFYKLNPGSFLKRFDLPDGLASF